MADATEASRGASIKVLPPEVCLIMASFLPEILLEYVRAQRVPEVCAIIRNLDTESLFLLTPEMMAWLSHILKLDNVHMFSAFVSKIKPIDEEQISHKVTVEYVHSICNEMLKHNSFKCYYYLLTHFPKFLHMWDGKLAIFRLQKGYVFELPIEQIYDWCSVLFSTIDESIMLRGARRELLFLNDVKNSHTIISLFLDYLDEHDRKVSLNFILNAIYDTEDLKKIEVWMNRLITCDLTGVDDLELVDCLGNDFVKFIKQMKILLPHCTLEDIINALSVSAHLGNLELVKFIIDTFDFTGSEKKVMQTFIDASLEGNENCAQYIFASRFCDPTDYDKVRLTHPLGRFWDGHYI